MLSRRTGPAAWTPPGGVGVPAVWARYTGHSVPALPLRLAWPVAPTVAALRKVCGASAQSCSSPPHSVSSLSKSGAAF
jgi:hypothetical protein